MKLESADPQTRQRFRDCVDAIARVDFAVAPGDPTPQSYYKARLGPPGPERDKALDKYLRYYLDLFELADRPPQGLKVLEVGSGFGLGLVAVAVLGADEANGVEIVPWQVEFALKARETLSDDLPQRVKPVVGTATDLPYAADTFDVVLSLEAVSHYLDYDPFLDEAHRVLRPGGVLVISDGNNGLNPLIRRKTRRIWASHEVDPRTDHVERPDSPWLFVPKRERIVTETDPSLAPDVAHDLALRTSGMVRSQIEEAVRTYADRGTLPESRYRVGTLTVHPEQEMVMERLFNPFALGREVADRGFDVRVRGHWGGAAGPRLVRVVNGVLGSLSRVTMPAARGFRIRAVKR
jgi:ubiquinone/menaquinone biosynthesis C-methylase UbiE